MRLLTRTAVVLGAAALVATGAAAAPAAAEPQGKARGVTSVALTADAAGAILGPLGGGVLTPASLTLSTATVSFPIVGNGRGGVIKHTGGLSFTGVNRVEIRNFAIDTGSSQITANTSVNGSAIGRQAIFALDGSTVSLTAFAAGALSDLVLGSPGAVPAGFVIGTATVSPR